MAWGPMAAHADNGQPLSPRATYNEGTQQLREGKLREAEAALQIAVASNLDRLQPPALYNLGHVRFQSGLAALKEAANSGAVQARNRAASQSADQAIRSADDALASDEIQAIVRAYQQGRGARKELKAALDAVKRAMDSYGAVLLRWQRASGDFKSAYELRPKFEDAKFNAQVVDRHIAALVDLLQAMQMTMKGADGKQKDLNRRLEELKKRLPNGSQEPGEGDDDDDDEQKNKGPQPGDMEKRGPDGREMALTPEEAMHLLEALRLDANRKLSMGDQDTSRPKDRNGRDW